MFWGQPSVALNALVKLVFSYRPPLLTPLHKLGFGFGTNPPRAPISPSQGLG